MSEELIVRRLKAALDVAPPDPTLRGRVISSLPPDRRQARAPQVRWAPVIAAGLAIAVVASLVWLAPSRPFLRPHSSTVPLTECQLPVFGYAPYQAGQQSAYEVGFLDMSIGTFTPGSSDEIAMVDQRSRDIGIQPAITYDRAANAWVPVRASWVAPDGMSYVYMSGQDLHIKNLHSRSDQILIGGKAMRLLGWSDGLIYYSMTDAYASDLWAVDPATRQDRQVVPFQSMSEWWMVGRGAVWGSPYYSGAIARYDTRTHAVSHWTLERLAELIGLDSAGNPVVFQRPDGADATSDPTQILVMHSNQSATSIGEIKGVKAVQLTVVADGDRLWLSASGQRIWVYSPDTGLVFLDQSSNSSLPNGLVVAGGCVSMGEVNPLGPNAG